MKLKNLITLTLCIGLMGLMSCKSNKDVNETASEEVAHHRGEGDRRR